MRINIRKLILSILIPLFLALLVSLTLGGFNSYNNIIKPSFAPPGILFPIVWTILYILMGISYYIVSESNSFNNNAKIIYIIQLIVNLLWSYVFFKFKLYLLSFIWIIVLIILVIIMIIKFYNIKKVSAYLQIPYFLWLLFASILCFNIYLLN